MMMPHQMNMQIPFPGMNPMMMGFNPQQHQRPPPGKIHINPKFAAMQQQKQQQLLQLQQQQLQLERQKQQQQRGVFHPTPTGDVSQDEITRQRQHLLEMQRKRQAQKTASSNTNSSGPVGTVNTATTTTKDDPSKSKVGLLSFILSIMWEL